MNYEHYNQLAALFDFPGPEFVTRGQQLAAVLREHYPEAAHEVGHFLDGIPDHILDLQELHTRTFDVQSITTLDIGYVLFGDDYKRAELLSNLTREHRQAENDCHGELADHLPNVLRLMPRLADVQLVEELVSEILVPALMLMIREFDTERIDKKNVSYEKHFKTLIAAAPGSTRTIYCRLLEALLHVVTTDFPVTERMTQLADWSGSKFAADFLGLVEKEMDIENNANPANSGCDS